MRRSVQAEQAESPAKRLAAFIAKFDPAVGKLVRSARTSLRRRLPSAVELVYDNYNALVIGFGPTERASDAIVSLAVYASGVNLYFIEGAQLSDPHRLLKGSGTQGRFIRLEDAAALETPAIATLLSAAVRQAHPPLRMTGHGYTVVKSVSVRQRPRRLTGRHR
jgi:hypothetical protein